MAIDFPASPTNGQTFTSGSVTYTWDGTKWTAVAAGGGSSDKISEGNSSAEVIDTGSDGRFVVTTEGTEALRVDASRRLLVGTSSARTVSYWDTPQVQIEGLDYQKSSLCIYNNQDFIFGSVLELGHSRGTSIGSNAALQNNDYLGTIAFYGSDGSNEIRGAEISTFVDGTPGANDMPGRLVFSTTADGASSPTERMRIDNTGRGYWYSTGPVGLGLYSSKASGTSDYLMLGTSGATGIDTGSTRLQIFTNGNIANTNNSYGQISDIKLKENVTDASSQWNDIKAVQVRNFNFIGDATRQIGVVAQEVEQVSPGLIDEAPDRDKDGSDLGTVTKSVKYSVLYMKAVKALQEAMERIETLEAKVAALESA